MIIKELIRQLKEYEKIYGPDAIVITSHQKPDPDNELGENFKIDVDRIVDGLDYRGGGTIIITSHEE
jgi:hypothetical protein